MPLPGPRVELTGRGLVATMCLLLAGTAALATNAASDRAEAASHGAESEAITTVHDGWGPEVEGLQCKVVADRQRWAADDDITFHVHAKEVHDSPLWLILSPQLGGRVELDGVSYHWHGPISWLGPQRAKLQMMPGPLKLSLRQGYTWATDQGQPLNLSPGKHTLRFVWAAAHSQAGDQPVELVSGPMEFEITPSDADAATEVAQRWLTLTRDGNRRAADELADDLADDRAQQLSIADHPEFASASSMPLERQFVSGSAVVMVYASHRQVGPGLHLVLRMKHAPQRPGGWLVADADLVPAADLEAQLVALARPIATSEMTQRTLPLSEFTMLDLETARVVQVDADWQQQTDDPLRWLATRGFDVSLIRRAGKGSDFWGVGFLGRMRRAEDDDWPNADRDRIEQLLVGRPLESTTLFPGAFELPATYAFETHGHPRYEPRLGLLRILAIDEDQQEVRLEYRLVDTGASDLEETTSSDDRLEFLRPIPEFRDLSLDITPNQVIQHAKRHTLRVEVDNRPGGSSSYHLFAPGGENVIVMFNADGECTGIQRMRPEPAGERRIWLDSELRKFLAKLLPDVEQAKQAESQLKDIWLDLVLQRSHLDALSLDDGITVLQRGKMALPTFYQLVLERHRQQSLEGDELTLARRLLNAYILDTLVIQPRKAGLAKDDLVVYLQQWTGDATLVAGRGPEAGKYDIAIDRQQIEATRRLQLDMQRQDIYGFDHRLVAARLEGDRLTFEVQTMLSTARDGKPLGRLRGERYVLRRTQLGWRTELNRWWPMAEVIGDKHLEFDAEAADNRVQQAREAGDLRKLAEALIDAARFREAYDVYHQLTQLQNPLPADWQLRASMALVTGNAEDARRAWAESQR